MNFGKKMLMLVLLVMGIISLYAQNTTIRGEVKDNEKTYSTVQLKSVYGNAPTVYTTADIDENGKFTIKYDLPEPDVYQLVFDRNRNQKLIICLTPGDNVDVILDKKDLQHLIAARGNKSVEVYKQIYDRIYNTKFTLDSLNAALQTDKDKKFYENFANRFNLFHQTNKDVDNYLLSAYAKVDSLKAYVAEMAKNGVVNKKVASEFLSHSIKSLKSIQNDYTPFENYQENIAQHYDFKNDRAQGHHDLYQDVDNYLTLLNDRQNIAKGSLAQFVAKAKVIVDRRDSLYFVNQLSNKKDVAELNNAIVLLVNQTNLMQDAKSYKAQTEQAYRQNSVLSQTIQNNVSKVVDKYQTQYDNTDKQNEAAMKEILSNNTNELVALLFMDRFPREKNAQLHKEIAENLHAKYPKEKLATERYNLEHSPAGRVVIGAEAPDMEFANPDGVMKKLSDLRGNIVLIDFWASWCRPCRMENPNVVRLYNKYHKKGFEVYSVSLDRDRNSWKRAIADDHLVWDNHVSDLGYWQSAGAKLYGVSSIPCTFLLDREGRIIAKNLRGEELHEALKKIFGE